MKKSILIIATVAFSIININATNEKSILNTSNEVVSFTKENIAQVFDWKVETDKGSYSGTSLSLENAKEMIALSSSGEIVLGTEIQSYLVLKSEINTSRNYFWEVETATGSAKGYASSEDYANKMIQLVASGDAVISKIIISQPQQ
ncbi:hypothetical protein CJ739_1917 [Mariniflexile rhizosphaerae]|uniref:hypothetical protein n=1 Tax=unclassified Mariniflexile TaxID=2643887 RepID=UPI000CAAF4B6|nr:hypothetical protein [Mariniflexile sp. TRM1-10]AXP81002.1 hypothetical protein CJ739_1917 [Mariniflexile sp. TRM1-10]PLB19917.1 MAG: hypothetical protein TRG1_1181 [Flavobacteriaceae bacterium FS1-H7996/R]